METIYQNALKQIVEFLEKVERELGIKYYLVRGVLSGLYSEIRATKDIDFVVDIYSVNHSIESYISLLKENNFHSFQDWETTITLAKQSKIIQFLDNQDRIKFDNYIIDKSDQSTYKKVGLIGLKGRVRVNFSGIECWATSKEDYIISKLIYGGWQDYCDALGCWMRFKEFLNVKYMDKIAFELKIQTELNLLKSGIEDPDDYFDRINGY